ncbi:hypothetical protein V8C44DRAFT_340189 [Trichoderma aethiopicum]
MHPFSTLTLGIFVAGYITARWDLVTRLYELAIFAVEYGVVVSRRQLCASRNSQISSFSGDRLSDVDARRSLSASSCE